VLDTLLRAAERRYHRSLAVARSQSATAGGIDIYWRPADYGRVTGRIYIAWCLAAILAWDDAQPSKWRSQALARRHRDDARETRWQPRRSASRSTIT